MWILPTLSYYQNYLKWTPIWLNLECRLTHAYLQLMTVAWTFSSTLVQKLIISVQVFQFLKPFLKNFWRKWMDVFGSYWFFFSPWWEILTINSAINLMENSQSNNWHLTNSIMEAKTYFCFMRWNHEVYGSVCERKQMINLKIPGLYPGNLNKCRPILVQGLRCNFWNK